MSTRRYKVALISLILGVLFIAMAAGYISSRRLLLSLGALALAGACLGVWAAVGKCWKPRGPAALRLA
jgi:hypothetical protein